LLTSEQITKELNSLPETVKSELASYLDHEGIGHALWNGADYIGSFTSPELKQILLTFNQVYDGFCTFLTEFDWDKEETCY